MIARVALASLGARPMTGLALGCALWVAACSVDRGKNPGYGCDESCDRCVMGFCLSEGDDAALRGDGDGDGTGDGDGGGIDGGDGCDTPGETGFCYEGPTETATEGRCKAGSRVCEDDGAWGPCLGQVTPQGESCNGDDDDCDGAVDEEVVLGACETGQVGSCGAGELSCDNGVAFCLSSVDPSGEVCDGSDNDCDGDVDEETEGACFPSGMTGCAPVEGGESFDCDGICAPGMRVCDEGSAAECEDFVGPQDEACDSGGTAADEDCDGKIDEGCACDADDSQECYSGPDGTEGRGICKAGLQRCEGGTYGECTGQTMPRAESCQNEGQDDDCDGDEDNIVGRGEPCVLGSGVGGSGTCRDGTLECDVNGGAALVCVPRQPEDEICNGFNDDCDNATDEDFNLNSDPNNCGECGRACEADQVCCEGDCVDTLRSPEHCGRCGEPCGDGIECCDGECATTVEHCGTCQNVCGDFLPSCCVAGMCINISIGGADECPGGTL